jgi:hypothetical protein
MLTISIHEILYLQVSRNVSIMVLRVMTLVIVIQCTQNFVLTNLPITKMVKSQKDMGKEWYLCACFNVCDFVNYNNVGCKQANRNHSCPLRWLFLGNILGIFSKKVFKKFFKDI